MARFLELIRLQKLQLQDEATSFAGKTVIITGGTGGLGLEAAKKIAALGAEKLIITARDMVKGQTAKDQIERHASKSVQRGSGARADVEVFDLDMSSYASVRLFAERINANFQQLDAVILNAGQINCVWGKSVEGWEQTLQVNTISTTLLALLLLPKLVENPAAGSTNSSDLPHLAFISSGLVRTIKPTLVRKYSDCPNALQTINAETSWPGGNPQYSLTKLLLEYSLRHMAQLPSVVTPSGRVNVVINSVAPGICKTDLGRQFTEKSTFVRILITIFFFLVGRTAEMGSRTYLTALTRGPESQGRMWKDDRYYDGGEMVESEEGAEFGEKVWAEVVHELEKIEPKINGILGRN